MPYSLRNRSESTSMSLTEEVKSYLQDLIKPLVKSNELKEILESFKNEVLTKIEFLEKKLVENDHTLELHQQKIDMLAKRT